MKAAIATFGAMTASAALAQAAPLASPPDRSSGSLSAAPATDEIVVTAQKREQSLTSVPISITAVTGDQLAQSRIVSTRDLQLIAPGLVAVNNGLNFQPSIRGISSTGTSAGDESNVSIYLDDVYQAAQIAGIFSLPDIERVEVLKGPQGTLFGRNATGGAIRIVTKEPSFTPTMSTSLSYGFERREVIASALASGPFTDTVAASATAYYQRSDGYVRNIAPQFRGKRYAGVDSYTLRGKLLFKPNDDFKFIVSGDASRRDDNAAFTTQVVDGVSRYKNMAGVVLPTRPRETSVSAEPLLIVKTHGITGDATYDGGDFTIRSISGYRRVTGDFGADQDRTNLALVSQSQTQAQTTFSEELDISNNGGGPLQWVAGAYYYDSNAVTNFKQFAGDYTNPAALSVGFDTRVKTEALAAFGELTYEVLPKIKVTGGARYTTERKELDYRDTFRPAGLRTLDDDHRWNSPTFRGVIQYEPNARTNLYASVSTGFKSGGYNSYTFPLNIVEPEKITAYEIGLKGSWRGLRYALAAFHYNYSDIQVQSSSSDPTTGVLTVKLLNAAKARVTGLDFDVSIPLIRGIRLRSAGSWLPEAKYSSFPTAQVFVVAPGGLGNTAITPYDASGSRLIRSPRLQLTNTLALNTRVAGGKLSANLTHSYNSGFYWQPGNLTAEEHYHQLNASVSFAPSGGPLTITAFGENLTNAAYGIYNSPNVNGIGKAYNAPRQYGLRMGLSI